MESVSVVVVPEAGETDNHPWLPVTDQVRVPPPVFRSERVWAAGLAAPCVAVNVNEEGLRLTAGSGALTVRVTGMVCGVLEAPVAVSMTDAV